MHMSLNAGAELDDELRDPSTSEYFEEPLQIGDVPELEEDIKLITAIENQLVDLDYLADSIEKAGGMSQDLAMEAERIVPGALGGRVVGFYTKAPSATLLRVSLEEINRTTWGLIAAAVVAGIALISKIIRWFTGKSGNPKDGTDIGTKVESAKTEASAVVEAVEALDREQAADGTPIGKILKRLATDSKTKTHQFLKEDLNEGVYDMLSKGTFRRNLEEAIQGIKQAELVLLQKVEIFDKAFMNDRSSDKIVDVFINRHELKLLDQPVQVRQKGGAMEITEAAQKLWDEWNTARQKPGRIDRDFLTVMISLKEAVEDKKFESKIESTQEEIDNLEKFRVGLQNVETFLNRKDNEGKFRDGELDFPSKEIGPIFREKIQILIREEVALTRLNGLVVEVYKTLVSLTHRSSGVLNELFAELDRIAKDEGVKLTDAIISVREDLKKNREKEKPSWFSRRR